jgi:hypothetical protein
MKTLKSIFAVSVVVFLAVASFAQQGNSPQTLSKTTLSAAVPPTVGSGVVSTVTLASITNVTATVEIGTVLWVDTEAMDVVTNSVPSSGTTLLVQRGAHGTRVQSHASGQTVYVGRPNLFQGYPVDGTCWTNTAQTALPTILPWINLTSGYRYDCRSDGNWYRVGHGSNDNDSIATINGFCSGTVGSAETEYLNFAACSGQTSLLYLYTVTTAGELANLQVHSTAVETAAAGDTVTVYKNGSATAITCKIPQTTAAICSDSTHAVVVVAGDVIGFQNVSPTSGAAANLSATVGIYGD